MELGESAIRVPPRDLGVFTPEDPAKGILVDSLGHPRASTGGIPWWTLWWTIP